MVNQANSLRATVYEVVSNNETSASDNKFDFRHSYTLIDERMYCGFWFKKLHLKMLLPPSWTELATRLNSIRCTQSKRLLFIVLIHQTYDYGKKLPLCCRFLFSIKSDCVTLVQNWKMQFWAKNNMKLLAVLFCLLNVCMGIDVTSSGNSTTVNAPAVQNHTEICLQVATENQSCKKFEECCRKACQHSPKPIKLSCFAFGQILTSKTKCYCVKSAPYFLTASPIIIAFLFFGCCLLSFQLMS